VRTCAENAVTNSATAIKSAFADLKRQRTSVDATKPGEEQVRRNAHNPTERLQCARWTDRHVHELNGAAEADSSAVVLTRGSGTSASMLAASSAQPIARASPLRVVRRPNTTVARAALPDPRGVSAVSRRGSILRRVNAALRNHVLAEQKRYARATIGRSAVPDPVRLATRGSSKPSTSLASSREHGRCECIDSLTRSFRAGTKRATALRHRLVPSGTRVRTAGPCSRPTVALRAIAAAARGRSTKEKLRSGKLARDPLLKKALRRPSRTTAVRAHQHAD